MVEEKFSIWLCPVNNDLIYISDIISHLSRKYSAPIFIPHVTIFSPIICDLRTLDNIVKNIVVDLKPLCVNVKNFEHSNFLWKTVFINLEINASLQSVFNKLNSKLSKFSSYNFLPHISLIYKSLDPLTRQKIIDTCSIKDSFCFDKIHIISSSENVLDWRIQKSYLL